MGTDEYANNYLLTERVVVKPGLVGWGGHSIPIVGWGGHSIPIVGWGGTLHPHSGMGWTLHPHSGVSWPSGLAYRTQVLVLAAECGFESRP